MRIARVDFPEDKWISTSPKRLDQSQQEDLWQVFNEAYKVVGVPHSSIQSFLQDLQVVWMIDVDDDDQPDAFIAYKRTPFGNKIQFSGSRRFATKKMILHQLMLLRKSGWYAEASHRPAEIFESSGFRPIDDHELVEMVLNKKVEWLGEGKYRRVITGVGPAVKALYGNPKGVDTSANAGARTASLDSIKRALYFFD